MKKTKLPGIITLLILTLVTAFFWVVFTVYRVIKKEPPATVSQEALIPLDAKIDSSILNKLMDRFYVEKEQLPEITVATLNPVPSKTPLPLSTPSPISSPSATPSAIATPSGEI